MPTPISQPRPMQVSCHRPSTRRNCPARPITDWSCSMDLVPRAPAETWILPIDGVAAPVGFMSVCRGLRAGVRLIPDGRPANRSLSAIEPVSATAKRKLENGEQRPVPETYPARGRNTENYRPETGIRQRNPRECRGFSHTGKQCPGDPTGWLPREDSNF